MRMLLPLSLLLLVCACTSANPRPPTSPPVPQPAPQPMRPAVTTFQPPPARPVSSDPGVRTLPSSAMGALVAETEPDGPPQAVGVPVAPTALPRPVVKPRTPTLGDGLGAPPTGPLAPLPGGR